MSRLAEIMRQIFRSDSQPEPEDNALPAWREVCRLYFVEPDEEGHFEYDVVVRIIHVSTEAGTVSVVLSCQLLRSHSAFKENDYVSGNVQITFHGVTNPSVTISNEPVPRNQTISLAHEGYYSVNRLELKPDLDGSFSLVADQKVYYYYLILFASSLKMMFPFTDLSYHELTDAEYGKLIDG